jgi:polysaccharide export outer membrane protein
VKTDGLSVSQLEKELSNRLTDGYLINPQITISVDKYNSKKVFVLGEVHKPGTYSLTGRTDLLDVISQAGDLTTDAKDEILIIRPPNHARQENPTMPQKARENEILTIDLRKLLSGDINSNIELREGDTVYVPKRGYFYVNGEVKSPGRYVLERETTVLKGITMAGGFSEKASKWRIKILRERDGKKIKIKAKMDQLVEPEDIISVPESFF